MKIQSKVMAAIVFGVLLSADLEGQLWKGQLQPAGLGAGDLFGGAVSVFENTAMAATRKHDAAGSNAGAVFVYGRDDNGTPSDLRDDVWVQTQKLLASDASPGSEFGSFVWIHRDTALIGADGKGDGAVYFLQRDDAGTVDPLDDTWIEIDQVTAASGGHSKFGRSASLFNGTAVIGTREGDAAFVFERRDAMTSDPFDDYWEQTARLTASDYSGGRSFSYGWSVSIYGDTVLVSARRDDEVVPNSGSVYAYQRDDRGTPGNPFDDLWPEIAKMWPSDPIGDAQMGRQIVLSGTTFIAGAFRALDSNGVSTGGAYLFERDDSGTPDYPFDDDWIEIAKLSPTDGATDDRYGGHVGLYGEHAVVGSVRHDSGADVGGAVYAYRRDDRGTLANPYDDSWLQVGKFIAEDPQYLDSFGGGVAINEDFVLAGAPYYYNAGDVVPGRVFAFDLVPGCTPAWYGSGLPGSSGIEPQIWTTGCAIPGSQVAVHIDRGMGGSFAVLAVGSVPASIPLSGGQLLVFPILMARVLPMNGVTNQAGGGACSFPALFPRDPTLVGQTVYLQGACFDAGAPLGLALTRGLELLIGG